MSLTSSHLAVLIDAVKYRTVFFAVEELPRLQRTLQMSRPRC